MMSVSVGSLNPPPAANSVMSAPAGNVAPSPANTTADAPSFSAASRPSAIANRKTERVHRRLGDLDQSHAAARAQDGLDRGRHEEEENVAASGRRLGEQGDERQL